MKRSSLAWLFCALALGVHADEGMWLFNQPPRQTLRERHQFDASDAWLEHLQKSSVRFNSGGSGSFVSANGLVLTNHHVGADALQKLGDAAAMNISGAGIGNVLRHNYIHDIYGNGTAVLRNDGWLKLGSCPVRLSR